MAHFAKVRDNVVVQVIVAEAEFFETFRDNSPGEWIQTSYNTAGGIHYDPNTGTPSADQTKALRKNYAGVGFLYHRNGDFFSPPKPVGFNSWTLNNETGLWEAPVPYPTPGGQVHVWNESTLQWDPLDEHPGD
jgi:hypothetical protein